MRTERGSASEACSKEHESGSLQTRSVEPFIPIDTRYARVNNKCRMVHTFLEGTIKVWEDGGGGAELHGLAEVVALLLAVRALATVDACLDSDALSDAQMGDGAADGGDYAGGFMAEHDRLANLEVTVATMRVVVDCLGSQLGMSCRTDIADARSEPQRPVAATAIWTWWGEGGQRVRSSTRSSLPVPG